MCKYMEIFKSYKDYIGYGYVIGKKPKIKIQIGGPLSVMIFVIASMACFQTHISHHPLLTFPLCKNKNRGCI